MLNRPVLYAHPFDPFLPCGTVPTDSSDVASCGTFDAIAMMEMPRSRGLVSTRSSSQARAQNEE